jgi:hypothetical protein
LAGGTLTGALNGTTASFSGEVGSTDFAPTGLTGATAASRYVGGTTNGAPTSGTFAVGDIVVDQTATIWVCTVAGTPGTWNPTTDGDIVLRSASGTAGNGEITVFQGGSAGQTINLPSSPVGGTTYQILNTANVSVNIKGNTYPLFIDGATLGAGSTYSVVVNATFTFTFVAGAINKWYCTSSNDADNLTGVVAIANGGTGLSTIGSNGTVPVSNGTSLSYGTTINGTAIPSSATLLTSTTGVTTLAGGTTGLTPASATSGAVTLAGTLVVANGGTNATTAYQAGLNVAPQPSGGVGWTPATISTPIKAVTFDTAVNAGTVAPTVGVAQYMMVYLLAGTVINTIGINVSTTTGFTLCAGLYNATGQVAANTAAGTAFASGSTGLQTVNLTSSYTVPTTGVYWVGLLFPNGTTAPTIVRSTQTTASYTNCGFTSTANNLSGGRYATLGTSLTQLPSTISGTPTNQGGMLWAIIY